MRHLLTALTLAAIAGCSDEDPNTHAGAAGSGNQAGAQTGGAAGAGGAGGVGGSAGGAGAAGAPAAAEVRFVGRVDESEAGVVRLSWSGSAIHFRFFGTEAAVRMDDSARFFTLLLDGVEQQRLETSKGEQSYPIATGLPAAEHDVWLLRRTEASFGETRWLGLELGSGSLLPPTAPATRRIEIVGDSITAGYGNEGADQNCNFSADTENHFLTYGAIAARELGAELVTVAWSGKGVIYNYGDDKNQPMPELYERAIATEAGSSWDFGAWQPQVVVVNLGTNDFSTDGDPSQALFTNAYASFLAKLRANNPDAYLLCLIPTLLGGADLASAQSYIEQAVALRKSEGDTKLEAHSLAFTQTGWGCDWHPSAQTHAAMGAALGAKLKSVMGW